MSLFSRWRARFSTRMRKDELDEELQFHLAMREQWNKDRGMPQGQARRNARLRFGNPAIWREQMRALDWTTLPRTTLQDLRYGCRTLGRNARFTVVAVFALALGIGINTTTFTAYKGLLRRGVDARDAGSIVNIILQRRSGERDPLFSYPDYEAYRQRSHAFSGVIAQSHEFEPLILSDAGGTLEDRKAASDSLFAKWGLLPSATLASKAEMASVFMVSENFFSVLGITPLRGRFFAEGDEEKLAASPAVLISENFWQKRFGGDPEIVGRAVRLNGAAVTIMGITPRDFVGTSIGVPDFWIPLSLEPVIHPRDRSLRDEEDRSCRLYGRLAPGITMDQAQAELSAIAVQQFNAHPKKNEKDPPASIHLMPGSPFGRELDSGLRFAISLIMTATAMVLVIACANVAGLQLARAASRQNELHVRASLGASRGRLIRQLLTESALLGIVAGAAALFCSWAMLRILAKVAKDTLPANMGTFVVHVNPDLEIFLYVFAISLVAGVLFGLAPAMESTRSALSSSLKANSVMSPARSGRLRDWLIGTQVALSFVLLIAGSLLVRSAIRALTMDTGYETKQVIDLGLQFPDGPEYDSVRQTALVDRIIERLAATPGVAATTTGRPPDGGGLRTAGIALDGKKPDPHGMGAYIFYTFVDANYFETLGIPIVYGRGFNRQAGTPEPVVVLSEKAAAQLWPGKNPIGRTLKMSTDGQYHEKNDLLPDGAAYQVVGIAHDVRGALLDNSDAAQIYLELPRDHRKDYPLLVRAAVPPGQLIHELSPAIASVDSNVVASAYTLDEMLRQTPPFMVSSMVALIAGTVGFLGLVLSAMGIYGTVSYMVVQRTREIGIRMAMGARKGDVLGMMLRQGSKPVLLGLLAGLVLATEDSYLLRGVLYGIARIDVVSFFVISVLFLLVAFLASCIPAQRAMRVEPVEALRCE